MTVYLDVSCLGCAQVSSEELQARYGVKAGPLHQLQERAGPFAAMVAAFCHRIGWTDLEELIAKLQVCLHQ